jgi:hypothetical protein
VRKQLFIFCFAASVSFAQIAPAVPPNPAPAASSTAQEVPADAPVITLQGLCPDKPTGTDPKSPDCKTIVTKAEFEHLANTLSPNMALSAKQSLASDYSRMLVLSNEARKHGLENSQHYKDLVNFLKMQLLAQELFRSYQEQSKPSVAELEKYYNDNVAKYEEFSLRRLFIPRSRPDQAQTPQKPGEPPTSAKPRTDAELQAEADKFRAQLVAGGDFDKLQQEVYTAAGFKTPPPPTGIPNWRHDAIPPSEQQLFELKPKEISKVMVEPAGAYIYQLIEKKTTSFAEAKPQIEATLTQDRMHQRMDAIMGSVKPEVNQAYFRSPQETTAPVTPKSR